MRLLARVPHDKRPEWRVLTVEREDGTQERLLCFAGRAADVLALGEGLPEGATIDPPKFPGGLRSVRLPPARSGGGGPGTAWRNSREGAGWEEEARRRRLELEQERMDRRTALMQAVALVGAGADTDVVIAAADALYAWLRGSSRPVEGGGGGPRPVSTQASPAEASSPSSPTSSVASAEDPTVCHCGARWGPHRTGRGRRVCTSGHVEQG